MAANTFNFMANPVFIFSWCLYADFKLYNSRTRIKTHYVRAAIPAAVFEVLAIANIFTPVIFKIDENNVYSRLPLSYLYYIVDAAYLFYSIYVLKGYEKKYGKIRFFPIFVYAILNDHELV